MVKQIITPLNKSVRQTHLSRIWFLARGYRQPNTCYTNGRVCWIHTKTNDVLDAYGQKITLNQLPKQNGGVRVKPRYFALPHQYGNMLLSRLKYLTFIGPIPEGYVIDHIDGDSFNNDINNLRAVPRAINDRDGGFMRKLRNNGIIVAIYPHSIILEGYKRMDVWKAQHSEWKYRHLDHDALLQIFLRKEDKL